MMSLLALTGMAAFDFGGLASGGTDGSSDQHYDELHSSGSDGYSGDDLLDLGLGTGAQSFTETPPDILDYERGDAVTGFNPATDSLELEYSAALGKPDVTIEDFADGSGASIALNGVVVADVDGAQGLDPASIILTAV